MAGQLPCFEKVRENERIDMIDIKYKAAIFDMDGTVLDTVRDLAAALNYALYETGHTVSVDYTAAALCFGSGVKVAVQRALAMESGFSREQLLLIGTEKQQLPDNASDEEVDRIERVYRPYYQEHSAEQTCEYEGISELLRQLHAAGIKTAIVSNKPHPAVSVLSEKYFPGLFDYAVGEQPALRRKPHGDMIEAALKELDIDKEDAVYIGDTEIDILTAMHTGMDCVCVSWGFRDRDFLKSQGAELIVDNMRQLCEAIIAAGVK